MQREKQKVRRNFRLFVYKFFSHDSRNLANLADSCTNSAHR
jgi:hypothetical protein